MYVERVQVHLQNSDMLCSYTHLVVLHVHVYMYVGTSLHACINAQTCILMHASVRFLLQQGVQTVE